MFQEAIFWLMSMLVAELSTSASQHDKEYDKINEI